MFHSPYDRPRKIRSFSQPVTPPRYQSQFGPTTGLAERASQNPPLPGSHQPISAPHDWSNFDAFFSDQRSATPPTRTVTEPASPALTQTGRLFQPPGSGWASSVARGIGAAVSAIGQTPVPREVPAPDAFGSRKYVPGVGYQEWMRGAGDQGRWVQSPPTGPDTAGALIPGYAHMTPAERAHALRPGYIPSEYNPREDATSILNGQRRPAPETADPASAPPATSTEASGVLPPVSYVDSLRPGPSIHDPLSFLSPEAAPPPKPDGTPAFDAMAAYQEARRRNQQRLSANPDSAR
jgi:hypothetical protein